MYFPLVLALTEVCLEIDNGIIQMADDEISLEVLFKLGLLVLRPIRPFYLMTVNGI